MKTHEENADPVEEDREQTVLIIDDDAASIVVISDYLEDSGFVVLVARNGESGIEKARYARPDIIFLDVLIPGIDGFETCRRLKSDPTTAGIPVIFMTSLTDTEDKVIGFEAGAVDYVTKPFQYREVLSRARMQLRLVALTRELRQTNKELTKHRDRLEELVEERTAEIKSVNLQLRVEIVERKLSEETLRVERDRLISAFEAMDDGVYIVNQDYDIEYVNPVLTAEFGPPDGRKCYAYFHDRETDCPWCKNQDVFAGKTVRWEWYSPKNDRTYDLIDTPLRNADGTISKLEIFRDITEHKQAGDALRESERKLTTLISSLPGMAYRCANQKDWPLEFASDGALELTGYTPADFMSQKVVFRELILSEDAEYVSEGVQEGVWQKRPYVLEYRIRTASGQTKWLWEKGTAIFSEDDQLMALEGFATDITDRKQAEEKIRAQSKFLQTAIDALTHPFYTINVKDYSISLFNKAAGINISEKTSTCYALTHGRSEPCRKDDHPCPIEEIKVTGRPTTVEHIHLDKNGNERIIEIHAFPIFDSEGDLSQIIEYSIDITERKTAEEELRKHREQLEDLVKERTNELEATHEELVKREKLSVLGRMTAMVSHELRNPLGVIRSSAFYLNRRLGNADEKTRKHLKRIEQQVGHCDFIVDELLEYTRGRRSEMFKGDLNTWLEGVLDEISISDEVSVVRELYPGLPATRFDKEKMRRAVINLVNNAVQAVIDRQERWQEEERPYRPQVKVATSMGDNSVSIDVEDNGIGMDNETANRAFEPLFTTRARGTGLGLAIVKKIIDEHGGSVTLKSKPDRGTKVTVKIPLLTRQQEQADGK